MGKILMRLATSGAPAAVKRRTVDPVHILKILPVYTQNIPMLKLLYKSLFIPTNVNSFF
jgi:hypothetical protein